MESPLPSFNPTPERGPLTPSPIVRPPSPKQQSWGAVLSIIIIVCMITLGAFYAWGKRIAEERGIYLQTATTTVTVQ